MLTNLSLVEAPDPVVSLTDAKAFLHVWHDDDDALITQLIAAATDKLDGAGGVLGRALGVQTWRLMLDCFPVGALKLPLPPFRSVESITYFDRNGDQQTLDPADYKASGVGGTGVIVSTGDWPDTWEFPGAVDIEFKAGYDDVPASLKHVILSLVFFWYSTRGAVNVGNIVNEIPFGFDDAVAAWQVPYVG